MAKLMIEKISEDAEKERLRLAAMRLSMKKSVAEIEEVLKKMRKKELREIGAIDALGKINATQWIRKVNDFMTCEEIAHTIFERFEINESATIKGHEGGKERGAIVLSIIEKLDQIENFGLDGKRKMNVLPKSIGGPIGNKVFRWSKRTSDGEVAYSIWRVQ